MSEFLVRVVAPHYVAGLITRDGIIVEAAPILKWSVGRSWEFFRWWCRRKGYEVLWLKIE